MLVRRCIPADFPVIAAIYNQSIALGASTFDCHPKSAQDIEQMVAQFSDRETILVGEKATQVIGWGRVKHYSERPGYRVCCETSIYLALAETGKGYGKVLQTALLKKVADLGYHHVVAKIIASNQKSIVFHQRFGFEMVGIQKEIGYMNDRWHDIALMQLVCTDVPPYQPELG